jgi:hypothetical protein
MNLVRRTNLYRSLEGNYRFETWFGQGLKAIYDGGVETCNFSNGISEALSELSSCIERIFQV